MNHIEELTKKIAKADRVTMIDTDGKELVIKDSGHHPQVDPARPGSDSKDYLCQTVTFYLRTPVTRQT